MQAPLAMSKQILDSTIYCTGIYLEYGLSSFFDRAKLSYLSLCLAILFHLTRLLLNWRIKHFSFCLAPNRKDLAYDVKRHMTFQCGLKSQRKITKSTNCTFLWISAPIHYSTRILHRKLPRCLELHILPSPLRSRPSISQPLISAMIFSIRFSMNLNCSFSLWPSSTQIYTVDFWGVHSPLLSSSIPLCSQSLIQLCSTTMFTEYPYGLGFLHCDVLYNLQLSAISLTLNAFLLRLMDHIH